MKSPRARSAFLTALAASTLLASCTPPAVRKEAGVVPRRWSYSLSASAERGDQGMVVTESPLATAVGSDILKSGGNAIDAAVATAFALAVVLPEAGNLGGGGFLVTTFANGQAAALDFRETAPGSASRNMYLDSQGRTTDGSVFSHSAAGVPGSVAGLYEAHRKYGTLPWPTVLAPAIRLAEKGFEIDESLAAHIRSDSSRLLRFSGSAELFFPSGVPRTPGSVWQNPDLAATLRRIAEHGPSDFYKGETAQLLLREMKRGGGLMTPEDLRAYTPKWREPLRFTYRGYQVISMPLPSSGGPTMAIIAGILEGYPLHLYKWHSVTSLHLLAEAMRRAFAERNATMGDPDFVTAPLTAMLSEDFFSRQRASIRPDHATPSREIVVDTSVMHPEKTNTTHLSVVDGQGNAVALTTTLNGGFGSAVTVSGAGFLLNNEMDDFTTQPGSPNMFGLVQGEANTIAPRKRPLSSMAPTIVLDEKGSPFLVTGAAGGPRIISAAFQVLSNIIDYGMDLPAAVSAPRIHLQHLPDTLRYEAQGLGELQVDSLRALGHRLQETPGIGVTATILRQDGRWYGFADPRSTGNAAGY